MDDSITNRLTWPVLLCLTLGLAPYSPEPHVVEKLRWLATGHAFRAVDVFDLVMHGAPWAYLAWTLVGIVRRPPQHPEAEREA